MRILSIHRQASAVGYYRTICPARALKRAGYDVLFHDELPYYKWMKVKGSRKINPEGWFKENLGRFDLLICDRAITPEEAGMLAGFRHYSPDCRMIVDFDDDFTNVPPWNQSHASFQPKQRNREVGLYHLRLSEMATVTTETLAERFRDKTHRIQVCPNALDPADWEGFPVDPDRAQDPHLRILYGGAAGHYGDLDVAHEGLGEIIENPPIPFRLIIFGAATSFLHEMRRRYPERIVILPFQYFSDYPATIAWGGFDLAIAPLADHPFNHAKSNIKWLESAIQKIPFFCSNIGPYAEIPDGCAIRVENTAEDWAMGLQAVMEDKTLRQRLASTAYESVRDAWTIDRTLPMWENALETASSAPRIDSLEATRVGSDDPEPLTPDAG